MSAIQKTALDAGSSTAFSATEAAKGMEELIKAGIDAQTVINGGLVPALNLATAGEISVAEAAEIASTALNTFNLDKSAASIERAGNVLSGAANASATSVREMKMSFSAVATVAAGMKFTIEDTANALAVMAQNGLKGSDAGTSLKTMLQNLQPDTKEQVALFKQLGIITKDNNNLFLDSSTGGFKSMTDIAQVLQDRLGKLTTADRAKKLEQMFGTDAVRAANIFFNQGAKGFNDMQEASRQFTMESIANERLNNLKGSIEMLKGSFETLLINVGMQLTPIFKNLIDFVTPLVNLFNDFAQTKTGQTVIKITAALSGLLVAIGLGIMAQSAFNIVSLTAVPILTSWAGSMGLATTSMSAFVISALPLIATIGLIVGGIALMVKSWQSFSNVLNGTEQPTNGFMGFMQKLGGIMQGIIEVFSTANSEGFTIGENLHNALQSVGVLDTVVAIGTWVVRIKELFKGFFAAFDNFSFDPLLNAFDRLFNVFSKFDNTLAGNSTSLKTWETVGWFVGNLVEGVFRTALFLLENVVNWVTFTVSVIVTLVNSIVNFGITVYNLFSQWWNGAITTQDLFFGVVGAIKTYFLEMFTGITDAFKQMINSFAISIATLPFGEKLLSFMGVNTVALGVKEAAKPSMLSVPTNQFALGTPTTADTMLQNSTAAVQQQQQVRNEFYQNNLTQQPPVVNVANSQAPINVTMELNGETVGKAVVDYQQQNGARQ
jgi:TP901 family phage tail tape measure protein